jgi:hypothetical protein
LAKAFRNGTVVFKGDVLAMFKNDLLQKKPEPKLVPKKK